MPDDIMAEDEEINEMFYDSDKWKLKIDFDPVDLAEQSGFELLDFSGHDALLLQAMPFHHKDTFDRMLIAQSITNKCHIMTDDKKFSLYDCLLL